MNLPDAQGRLARWRLRLAEFDFKVEYHPGSAHHAADALSRLPHQPVPAQPIDLDIPVLALYEDRVDTTLGISSMEELVSPIEEIPLVTAESLFEHQCRDQLAQRKWERTSIDPMWDSDKHGLLIQRLPSRELQIDVPSSISRDGPC